LGHWQTNEDNKILTENLKKKKSRVLRKYWRIFLLSGSLWLDFNIFTNDSHF